MGLFDGLKKEGACQKCARVVEKKQLTFFDPDWYTYPEKREQLALCRECCLSLLSEMISRFEGVMVAIPPDLKHRKYHFYLFNEMPEFDYPETEVASLRTLLPPAQKACACGRFSAVTWCVPGPSASDLMDNEAGIVNSVKQFLCKDCFAKRLTEYAREHDLYFEEIISPVKGDGFFTPVNL